jgi:hypothetical protein
MRIVSIGFISSVLLACGQGSSEPQTERVRGLSPSEQAAMNSANVDGGVSAVLRSKIRETFYLHTPEAYDMNRRNDFLAQKHAFRGVAFKVHPDSTADRIAAIAHRIRPEGYKAYRSRMGFGGEHDEVCVLQTQQVDLGILRYEQTDGINYDITTDSLVSVLLEWSKEFDLSITGASGDWVEASIGKEPKDWNEFAARVYAFCPDVVDQGTGSVAALADQMKQTRTLYLWWD